MYSCLFLYFIKKYQVYGNGNYDRISGINLNIIKKTTKLAYDYDRLFFVYNQETDIYGNKVMRKELYEGSQKRFIYYVPKLQK